MTRQREVAIPDTFLCAPDNPGGIPNCSGDPPDPVKGQTSRPRTPTTLVPCSLGLYVPTRTWVSRSHRQPNEDG